MEEKVIAEISASDASPLENAAFDYLSSAEKNTIKERIANDLSILVVFHAKEKFFAVFDLEENRLHLREAAGNFPAHGKTLYVFTEGLAHVLGAVEISCNTRRKGSEKFAKQFGLKNQSENFWQKRLV